ncbi:hypothetical protein [Bradyrhizobium cenepequi]|uniref:hypothetical protein n=1 Tax=Bradyrhizobium cenepequi TaxID=2821403 RepID=UPI001CE33DDB|nr:hypothetical protein [Bradyrhizobium cenepequi]MCA6111937.1 hypothetical protein [Bradyrhizobium cenepequi]
MFEISIFCVVLLAAGYGVTMWVIGRRADVLHGKFVEAEPEPEPFGIGPLEPPAPRANAESLRALLTVIQQELKDTAKI